MVASWSTRELNRTLPRCRASMFTAIRMRPPSRKSSTMPPVRAKRGASLTVRTNLPLSVPMTSSRIFLIGAAEIQDMTRRQRRAGREPPDGQRVAFDGPALDRLFERARDSSVVDDAQGQRRAGRHGIGRPLDELCEVEQVRGFESGRRHRLRRRRHTGQKRRPSEPPRRYDAHATNLSPGIPERPSKSDPDRPPVLFDRIAEVFLRARVGIAGVEQIANLSCERHRASNRQVEGRVCDARRGRRSLPARVVRVLRYCHSNDANEPSRGPGTLSLSFARCRGELVSRWPSGAASLASCSV